MDEDVPPWSLGVTIEYAVFGDETASAGLKELWELHKVHLDAHGWSVLALGLLVASISAFFAIWSLMRILERFTAWPFVIYRALLGFVLLAGVATGWLI